MKTIILSKSPYIYSTDVILKEFKKRNKKIESINPLECNTYIDGKNSFVLHNGEPLKNINYVIPRIGAASHYYGIYIVQALEAKGVKCLNSYQGLLNCRNKHNTYELLHHNNLPTPKTALAKSSKDLDYMLNILNGFPVIVKLTRGSQGKGVMIADSYNTLKSIIDTMTLLEEDIILQEYFETEPKYSDIRVYVLENEVIGSTQRINKYDFRSNTHCGGSMKQIKIDQSLKDLAIKASTCSNLNFCSIDFLITNEGPKILEINSTPGFEKVETEAKLNLSSILTTYIENQLCSTNIQI